MGELLQVLPNTLDTAVFSYEVGFQKPEPEIYHYVIQKMALPAGGILLIGDSARNDVSGQKTVGMGCSYR